MKSSFLCLAGLRVLAFTALALALPLRADAPLHPFVDAGSSRSVWLNHPSVDLKGHLQGIGDGAALTWAKTVGAGNVTFSNEHALETTATFDTAGVYELQLTAKDAAGDHSDRLTVTVYDSAKDMPFDSWLVKGQKVKQDFGYSDDELHKYFTGDLNITYDLAGLDWDRVKPPPAPYVHPRILINDDQKPDLVKRLTTTEEGKRTMKAITNQVAKGLTSDGAPYRAAYDELASGKTDAFAAMQVKGSKLNPSVLMAMLTYEIFRAYVTDDDLAGKKAVAALATIAPFELAVIQAKNSSDWRDGNSDACGHQFLGLAYDFGYNLMTPEQQQAVRATLTAATTNQWSIGLDALPAYGANCSNWIANNDLYLLIDGLAVEGETGSDPTLFPRMRASYERFFSLGVARDGALYEGMGKGQINAESLIALAKRGKYLIASTSARYHVSKFYLACLETTGYGFTWDELLGGNNGDSKYADVATLKYAFPQDPAIDMVFRNDMGTQKDGDYSRSEGLNLINFGFIYQTPDTLTRAIFAEDCDTSKPIDQALAALNGVVPKTAFFNERGLLITRSSWDTDALRLMFQPRSEPGGHGIADRDFFALSALGRVWIPYIGYGGGYKGDNSARSSVVRIDDKGPSILAAKFVEYNDGDLFTYGVGDAKIPYSKQPATDKEGAVEDYTFNQNRLKPGPELWADMPWGQLSHWYTSEHAKENWKDTRPMERAFRTVALARGRSPYALVIDDIQQDEAPHAYTWRVAVEKDVTITVNGNDAVLADPTNTKRLLVRLVDAKGTPTIAENEIKWMGYFNREASQKLLEITTTAPAPDFKVLLVPYLDGAPLPKTSYQGGVLTVEMANGQADRIDCAVDPSGRTTVKFNRLKEGNP